MSIPIRDITDAVVPGPTGLDRARRVLHQAVKDEPAFDWLKSFESTTEQVLATRLATSDRPVRGLHDPCNFQDALNVGTQLLEQCLVRATQIREVESQAFVAALEYLSETVQEGIGLQISSLELKASRVLANANQDDADFPLLSEQLQNRQGLRRLKMAMHSSPGHPLNFLERIQLLQRLQLNQVRSALEYFAAAHAGLSQALQVPLREVPAWRSDSTENLVALVEWSQEVQRTFQAGQSKERIVLRTLRIDRDLMGSGQPSLEQLIAGHGSGDPIPVNFTIDNASLGLQSDEVPRLLSLGLAVELDDEQSLSTHKQSLSKTPEERSKFQQNDSYMRALRDRFTFSLSLQLPEQKAVGMQWQRPRIQLVNEVRVWQTVLNEAPAILRMPQIRNASPLGAWQVALEPHFMAGSTSTDLKHNLLRNLPNSEALLAVRDLVLWVRLAVRPRSNHA